MERATIADLTTPHLEEDEAFPLPKLGMTVRLRGLSRWEMTEVQKLEKNRQQQENVALHYAMVDPPMGEHEVLAWRKAGGNDEIESVARRVNELSGIGKDAQKSGVDGDGAEPGA